MHVRDLTGKKITVNNI